MINFSTRNPLITNLLLVLVLIGGIFSWQRMPQEMFPLVELDKLSITTLFPGASPEEVERQITLPIEQELDALADIDVITSTSSEGRSRIILEVKKGTDVGAFEREADALLNRITDLPEEAESPVLTRLETRFPVISMALYGEVSSAYLNEQAEEIKRRLMQLPGVASVGTAGDRDWEMWVVVDPEQLAVYGISLNDLKLALQQNLRDLPGGSIRAREGDILLRGVGAAPEQASIADIILRSDEQGGRLTVGRVAEVELRLEEALTLGRYNGRPSINFTVNKTADSSTIKVSQQVREFAAKLQQEVPAGLEVGVFSDLSVFVKNRLETVKSSGLIGLILVLLALYFFLNFRVALVTAMGIPVSFLIAIILINQFDYTINMVSLFAFLIALGMIVDDAIIVNENIYRHMEQGMPAAEAARTGAREVMWPVIASTTTTIAAFLPMYAFGGTMGAFISVIPAVVTFALLGSLWEAFGVLPSHAKELLHYTPKKDDNPRWQRYLGKYVEVLRWCLHNRGFVVTATIGTLLLFIAIAATRVPFEMFGHSSSGQFFINVEAPRTYTLEDSTRLAEHIEQAVAEEMDEETELDSLLSNIGVKFISFNQIKFGSNQLQFIVGLKQEAPQGFIDNWVTPVINLQFETSGTRERDTDTIINALRQRMEGITGIEKFNILRAQGGPGGTDVELGISGNHVDTLYSIAENIREQLRRMPGVYDVSHDMEVGKLEYQYTLNEQGRLLGLNQNQLADAVRTGFQGLEAVHVNWRDKRIAVRMIYPEALRSDAQSLARLPITLPSGESVYLGDVADIQIGRSLSGINRRDQQRLVTLSAEVDVETTTALEVNDALKPFVHEQLQQHPGYEAVWLGSKKETNESMRDMMQAMLFSLVVIFFILAALFKSLLDPLVVMFAIPFGLIGIITGHIAMGMHLQFLSVIGFLALSGIVVNDSLILIDFAKRLREQGMERIEAVVEAGRVRARPILLTSATTFLGVSPLIFFATGQTEFLSPMAVSLGYGLLFATVLILVALPCFYLMADDMRHWVCGVLRGLMGREKMDAARTTCSLGDGER